MSINLKIIDDFSKEMWEQAVTGFPEANFLQSWNWGAFQQSLGKRVIRLAWQETNSQKIVALAQVVVEKAKRGSYLSLAGGPLLLWSNEVLVQTVFTQLRLLAHQQHCWFIRFRPQALVTASKPQEESQEEKVTSWAAGQPAAVIEPKTIRLIGCRQAPMHLTADLTIQLDLTLTDEELLSQMRKNHRQSIRKATNLGITTRVSGDENDLNKFYDEQLSLARRHGFVPFSREFLTKQFQVFVKENQVILVHAELDNQLLASAFVIFYNGEAVYHYGISTELNQKLPGSYACQWRVIQEAKARGCRRYNLWGVAPKAETNHRFAGVGLFKRGFGGLEVAYLPAQDVVTNNCYYLTWLFELGRKKFRKL